MADFYEDGGVMCDNRAKSLKTSKKVFTIIIYVIIKVIKDKE